MNSKMKKIIIVITVVALLIGGWKLYFYLTEPIPLIVMFNDNVQEKDAVATVEKYKMGVSDREHIEYDNPFFNWLYPFSDPNRRSIELEVSKIRANRLGRQIEKEVGVKKVIVLKHSYSEAKKYKEFFESLNPDLIK